jgi:outer membrane murein-binding lipoprotein Lpp
MCFNSDPKEENKMKRILAVLFVVALAFTMVAGCASTKEVKQLQEQTQQALDRAKAAEQQCTASANQAAASARRAEDAANKAEAMANKCESIFMKHMKK